MSEQPPETGKYTCKCYDPCFGSITCDTGCYAFCEENPEGSGRYVCVRGCVSAILDHLDNLPVGRLRTTSRFASVELKMPACLVRPSLERLFATELPSLDLNREIDISISLTNVDLKDILEELHKQGGQRPPSSQV